MTQAVTPQQLVQQQIRQKQFDLSTVQYELKKVKVRVGELEALAALHERELAVYEGAATALSQAQEASDKLQRKAEAEHAALLQQSKDQAAAHLREPAQAEAPAPKPQKVRPDKPQAPRPAKRRGRPPGRKSAPKPEPIQDEPTQAGGSWNGNGGMTPEQAAAQ